MNTGLHKSIATFLVFIGFLTCLGCSGETKEEKMKRALTDKSLSESQSVQLLAECFFNVEKAEVSPGTDGQLTLDLIVHGADTSGMPASVIDTAQGGIVKAMKKTQVMQFIFDLREFLEKTQNHKLKEIAVTLKMPESKEGKVIDWIDIYRMRLPGNKVQPFLALTNFKNVPDIVDAAEKIWKVEFDHFDQIEYSKE